MFRRGMLIVALLTAVPVHASAQGTERYLPSGSQIVLQVDAAAKTKTAYDRTAQGQLWSGDTGKFVRNYYKWLLDTAESAVNEYQFMAKEDFASIKDGLRLAEKVNDEGLAMGIEIKKAWPVDARIVVALPKLGNGQPNLIRTINELREKAKEFAGVVEVKEERIAGRTVYFVDTPFASVGWFAQGDDFIMTLGTGKVDTYVKAIDAGKVGIANNPTYRQLLNMGDFPVRTRAYVDTPNLVKLSNDFSDDIKKTIDEVGAKSFGPVFTVSGFDGLACRTITETEVIGARKGFANLVGNKALTMADLPVMPSDTVTFTAASTNPAKMYSTFMETAEKVGKIYFPEQVDNLKQGIKGFEDIIGVDLKADLFESFDNVYVDYSAPSEGILKGGATLFKVKDEAKLKKAINNLISAIPQIPGVESGIKKRKYRGVDLIEFHANTPGSFAVTTLCVYKGYLVYANYPQPVYGYILRADGVLPKWKADERLTKALATFPKEFTSISYSDPQGSIQSILAEAPAVISLLNGFASMIPNVHAFDISQIPQAQEATRNLFPNISITVDDGKKIRLDQRSSVGG